MRFLEYEISTGRIISEVVADTLPVTSGDYGLFRIDDNVSIDTSLYAVRNGTLVKLYETLQEKLDRERIRKEQAESSRLRLRTMCYELSIAILEEDEKAIQELKKEYRTMKPYL